mgnify:CR=1 FL=1
MAASRWPTASSGTICSINKHDVTDFDFKERHSLMNIFTGIMPGVVSSVTDGGIVTVFVIA